MKILLTTTSLLPSYGGPAFSVSRLAKTLAEAGIRVGLWAANQSAMKSPLTEQAQGVTLLTGNATQALSCFGKPDILHDNGIWLPHNHELAQLTRKWGIPRIVSTRGMLEPWAMRHKRWKKHLAWVLYQKRDLVSADCLHATADMEVKSISRHGLHVPICVIPNGVDVPGFSDLGRPSRSTRMVLSLGRIHPKKGLDALLRAWAQVEPNFPDWRLHVVGPSERGYADSLKRLGTELGLARFTLEDAVFGDAKAKTFRDCDLFVLPSHSENFGIAVAEALAAGRPVITTKGTPWEGLETRHCGWWIEKSIDSLAAALTLAMRLPGEELLEIGARGREWMAHDFGWESVAHRFISTYTNVIAERRANLNPGRCPFKCQN